MDGHGQSPLHLAAELKQEQVVAALLRRGACPNSLNGLGESPLFIAAETGNTAVVKTLLVAGVDPSVRWLSVDNSAPLDTAVTYRMIEMARVLVQFGADVNSANAKGRVALHQAAFHSKVDLAKFLLEAGADIQGGKNSWTPLHAAASEGACDVMLILLQNGAMVKCRV